MKVREMLSKLQNYPLDADITVVFHWKGQTVVDDVLYIAENGGPQLGTESFYRFLYPEEGREHEVTDHG